MAIRRVVRGSCRLLSLLHGLVARPKVEEQKGELDETNKREEAEKEDEVALVGGGELVLNGRHGGDDECQKVGCR